MRWCKLLLFYLHRSYLFSNTSVLCGSSLTSTQMQHANAQVNAAMIEQINKLSYCASSFFKTNVVEEAARMLVDSTEGHMTRAYIVNSGQSVVLNIEGLSR